MFSYNHEITRIFTRNLFLERKTLENIARLLLDDVGLPGFSTNEAEYMCTGCNLKCRHCWITPTFVNGEPSPGDAIDVDLLRAAVEEAAQRGEFPVTRKRSLHKTETKKLGGDTK